MFVHGVSFASFIFNPDYMPMFSKENINIVFFRIRLLCFFLTLDPPLLLSKVCLKSKLSFHLFCFDRF